MTKWLLAVLIVLFPLDSAFAGQRGALARQELEKAVQILRSKVPSGKRIGVDNLKGDTPSHDITDFLMTALTREGYVPLDRRSLEEIFKHQGLELSDVFDQETVEAIGNIKGVDAILYGTVKEYSNFGGKAKLNAHLQCSYLGGGGTPWAYDLVGESTSKGRRTLPFFIGGGVLVLIIAIYFGLRGSGKTKVLNR